MRLLYKEELKGQDMLDIFKKYGILCGTTDYAIFCGNSVLFNYDLSGNYYRYLTSSGQSRYLLPEEKLYEKINSGEVIEIVKGKLLPATYERCCNYFTQSLVEDIDDVAMSDYYVYNVEACGKIYYTTIESIDYGIRPVLSLTELSELVPVTWINEDTLTAGEFPNHHEVKPTSFLAQYTKKRYSINSLPVGQKEPVYISNEEFLLNNAKYVTTQRIIQPQLYFPSSPNNIDDSKTLSDGYNVLSLEKHRFQVEPLEWLYDKKTNLVIAKRAIMSGIPFNYIKKYLDEILINEIIPSTEKTKILNKKINN